MADDLFGPSNPAGGALVKIAAAPGAGDQAEPGQARRRGRPKGSTNKRSGDLRRYIEAMYAGMTPGQQSAQIALVTPRELRQAKKAALALGLAEVGLSPMMLAQVVKAKALAMALGCQAKEAWLLLQKERAELLPFMHQRLPQAPDPTEGQERTVYMIPDGAPGVALDLGEDDAEEADDADDLVIIDQVQPHVSRRKSHDPDETQEG